MIVPLLQAKADLFGVLANPLRIRLLELLSDRDHEVDEFLREIEADPSEISEQLAVLRHAQLIEVFRTGAAVLYTLRTPSVVNLLGDARHVLGEVQEEPEHLRPELVPLAVSSSGVGARRWGR